jgi:hypothetical protein
MSKDNFAKRITSILPKEDAAMVTVAVKLCMLTMITQKPLRVSTITSNTATRFIFTVFAITF